MNDLDAGALKILFIFTFKNDDNIYTCKKTSKRYNFVIFELVNEGDLQTRSTQYQRNTVVHMGGSQERVCALCMVSRVVLSSVCSDLEVLSFFSLNFRETSQKMMVLSLN